MSEPRVDFRTLPPVETGSGARGEWALARAQLAGGDRILRILTTISIVGVMVGVAALNAVVGVMAGFQVDIRQKILGANAHMVVGQALHEIHDPGEITAVVDQVPGVELSQPFTFSEVMIRSRLGTTGAMMKGINPAKGAERIAGTVSSAMVNGELTPEQKLTTVQSLSEKSANDEGKELPTILLGQDMMEGLSVVPGEVVHVINPVGGGSGLMGVPLPTVRQFKVVGAFKTGMYQYDTTWAYVDIQNAREFMKMTAGASNVEIWVDDIDAVPELKQQVEKSLGYPYFVMTWQEMNAPLYAALAQEKVVMGLILGLIVAVAGLLVVSNLYTLVITKTKAISILRAIGASRAAILRVYVMLGATIGGVGVIAGSALGLLLCFLIELIEFPLDTDVYLITSLPVEVEPINFIVIALSAWSICVLAAIHPAVSASRVDPIEGLRQ